ncbi:MAG: flagellar motor switch protein FliN [Candidatus Omnitrophota bacterium]|nr:MAG: flagellar motor switch protein FliN [Candidatus Omnitrophota bacterium]
MANDKPLSQEEIDQLTKGGAVAEATAAQEAQTQVAGDGGPQKAQFSDLAKPAVPGKANSIDLIMDVPMDVTIELGRTMMSIKDILALGSGSIIELDKLAGDPVDILVNNKLIANGEVVVIEDNFGVRITNIVSQEQRADGLT